jgi:hypothetical protein
MAQILADAIESLVSGLRGVKETMITSEFRLRLQRSEFSVQRAANLRINEI